MKKLNLSQKNKMRKFHLLEPAQKWFNESVFDFVKNCPFIPVKSWDYDDFYKHNNSNYSIFILNYNDDQFYIVPTNSGFYLIKNTGGNSVKNLFIKDFEILFKYEERPSFVLKKELKKLKGFCDKNQISYFREIVILNQILSKRK